MAHDLPNNRRGLVDPSQQTSSTDQVTEIPMMCHDLPGNSYTPILEGRNHHKSDNFCVRHERSWIIYINIAEVV